MIWQVPNGLCKRYEKKNGEFDLKMDLFGFLANPRDRWAGEYQTIFYNYGRFPMYAFSDPRREDNGGIPQRGNLAFHLQSAYEDIMEKIPNSKFAGIAVLNQEEWRPLFNQNFGVKSIYQDQSIIYYAANHPEQTGNMSQIIEGATNQFDHSSILFSVESLKLGRSMRPHGKWGYYAFPYCYNAKVPVNDTCSDSTRAINTRLKPMWEAASAIFPSIYLWHTYNPLDRAKFIYSQVEEGIRVAGLSDEYTPVYVYTRMLYNDVDQPYSNSDIYATLRITADFGVEGIVMWGANADYANYQSCNKMQTIIKDVVGPYARRLKQWVAECSRELCNGQGKCVHRGTLDHQYRHEVYRQSGSQFDDWTIREKDGSTKYKCKCLHIWRGDDCSKRG